MSDPVARRLAAAALGAALTALVLAGWSAWRAESELHDLRRAVERAITAQGSAARPSTTLGRPPLELDTEE